MGFMLIDGIGLPAPTKFKLPNFDLDSEDSNRNEFGVFQRDRIRQGVNKGEFEWVLIPSAQLATIKNAIKPAKVIATLPTESGDEDFEMYVGDRNVELVVYDKDYTKRLWNISFSLTEY